MERRRRNASAVRLPHQRAEQRWIEARRGAHERCRPRRWYIRAPTTSSADQQCDIRA
jgi:hypothetical protein